LFNAQAWFDIERMGPPQKQYRFRLTINEIREQGNSKVSDNIRWKYNRSLE
jgi:hypothetical protein